METKTQETVVLNNLPYLISRTEDRINELRDLLKSGRASIYTANTLEPNYAMLAYLKSLEEKALQ